MNRPKVRTIVPMSAPMDVVYLFLYTAEGTEEFEQRRDRVLGMALLGRDHDDGHTDYLVHEAEWRCPVTLEEFDEHCTNRYVIGVFPPGVEPEEWDVNEAKEALRTQVKAQQELIRQRIAEARAKAAC